MKVLLDEDLVGMEEHLLSYGFHVTSVVREKMSGAKDFEVVLHAKKNDYVLITRDEKPAGIAKLHGVRCIWLSFSKLAEIAVKELQDLLKE
jgi:predicted nuclease of predicted toxin-antitoxin system